MSMCPHCEGIGMGVNVYSAADAAHEVGGFTIDGEAGAVWVESLLRELHALHDGATFDDVLAVLAHEPRAEPIRDYLAANRVTLLQTGIAAASLAVSLLSYLHVTQDDPEPPTRDQIERIIDELEEQNQQQPPTDDVQQRPGR